MSILIMFNLIITSIFVTNGVQGRSLKLSLSHINPLVSDGGLHQIDSNESSILSLDGPPKLSGFCFHMYGFFPCADNIPGYIFQIAIFQYLLIVGEKLLNKGSIIMFNILGTGIFGASVFRVLMVLPAIFLMIASGLFAPQESAQIQAALGVSVCAGVTVFSLTLLWGMCVIFGRTEKAGKATEPSFEFPLGRCLMKKRKPRKWADSVIETDAETKYTAGIMLLSLIPIILMQLISVLETIMESRTIILTALIVSIAGLLSYFLYQIVDPWMQERSLEYTKYENLLAGFLRHVQKHAKGKLIDHNGQPNITVIKRLFAHVDLDKDQCISPRELEFLIFEIFEGEKLKMNKDYAMDEILKAFDLNNDGKIDLEEFTKGVQRWLHEAQELAKSNYCTANLLHKIIHPITKKKIDKITKVEQLMAKILKNIQEQKNKANRLLKDDGSPNIEQIRKLFHQYDSDKNNVITKDELEELICTNGLSEVQLDQSAMAEELMKEFDIDGNNVIDEQEFVSGVLKWINEAMRIAKCEHTNDAINEYDKIMWREVEILVYEVEKDGHKDYKLLTWAFGKSLFQVILGISILTTCAGPLMINILELSDSLDIPSFFISFVIVPVAMNVRRTISTVFPASGKSSKTSSLTFSEIYGGVMMNNIMGMTILLVIIYAKDLTWNYSAEGLIVLVVCGTIGLLAYFRSTYPLWTSFLAFSLYPFSLVLYYVVQYFSGWN